MTWKISVGAFILYLASFKHSIINALVPPPHRHRRICEIREPKNLSGAAVDILKKRSREEGDFNSFEFDICS